MNSTACPDKVTLQKYLEDALPQQEYRMLEEHIEACATCEQLLQQLASSPDLLLAVDQQATDTWKKEETFCPLPEGTKVVASIAYGAFHLHATGGLGELWKVRDESFHRQVALKIIRPRYQDDAPSHDRFIREAEITAGLEHPGIAPVYSIGTFADGRPYYVMRFIQGTTLKDSIRQLHQSEGRPVDLTEQNEQLRELLGRFVDACEAMEYAHSRKVVHRDLKPDNIIVGNYGETVVVDWGLAKAIGGDAQAGQNHLRPPSSNTTAATQMGLGTPQYMSPEQARGGVQVAATASDIYSLGATLYCLLTGQAAFPSPGQAGVEQVLQQVIAGEFLAPRKINRTVPAPLEAICLKAMAANPADRYKSGNSLVQDINRWLADEPLSAYRDRVSERFGRWIRKHRTRAASAAVLLVTAVISLAAGLAFVQHERSKTEQQRLKSVAAQIQAERESENAKVARGEADENRRFAESQMELNRDLVRDIVFEMNSTLSELPGYQEMRRKLLATALTRLTKSAESIEAGTDSALIRFRTHLELGKLLATFGDIDGKNATNLARSQYEMAYLLADETLRAYPDNAELKRDFATACVKLGETCEDQADVDKAYEYYLRCQATLTEIMGLQPDSVRDRRASSVILNRLGDIALSSDRFSAAEALAHYRESLETVQQLADENVADDLLQFDLAICHIKNGDAHRAALDARATVDAYSKGLAIVRALTEKYPDDLQYRRFLSVALNKAGQGFKMTGDVRRTREAFWGSLDVIRGLAEENSQNIGLQRDLSVSLNKLGSSMLEMGELAGASDAYKQAFAIRARLAADDPQSALAQRDLMASHNNLGDVALQENDLDEALSAFRAGFEIVVQLAATEPSNVELQADMSGSHQKIADVLAQKKEYPAARDAYKKCLELRKEMFTVDDSKLNSLSSLLNTYLRLGVIERILQNDATALEHYAAAMSLLSEIEQGGTLPANLELQKLRDIFAEQIAQIRREQPQD